MVQRKVTYRLYPTKRQVEALKRFTLGALPAVEHGAGRTPQGLAGRAGFPLFFRSVQVTDWMAGTVPPAQVGQRPIPAGDAQATG